MGGGASRPRKLTLENNSSSVIEVSECVVNRMRGTSEELVRQAQRAPRAPTQGAFGDAMLDPWLYQPSLTSIQIRQETVKALRENDNYWDRRMEDLQKKHKEIQQVMEAEFDAAFETYGNKKALQSATKTSKGGSGEPCLEGKKRLIGCFRKHQHEPMRCADEVRAFSECVEAQRRALFVDKNKSEVVSDNRKSVVEGEKGI